MHVEKFIPVIIFFFNSFSTTAFAIYSDSLQLHKRDTAKINASRLINRNFNNAYLQNLRPSYAGQDFFDPKKTLLVADLSTHFVLLNTPKLPFFFVASARVNIRLLADHGSPVESPSYMPGGTLYFRTNSDSYNPRFLSVSYTHHSNGARAATLNRNNSFNIDSGEFTTNFYTLTFHAGKRVERKGLIINRYNAIGLELHSALVDKGYSEGLKGRYGFVRVNGNWLYIISKARRDIVNPNKKAFENWQHIQLDFAYIADKYDNYKITDVKKRLNINLKYYYRFPFMQNVSLVAGAGYRGQDDYNILFQDSYAYITLGFAAGLAFNAHN
ncbi:hypothetical protein [Mucilaginibacter sp.]|uniref:hypothetical protein n=1 Tax=Mucilaginibacter sp. TaxID=1882438 RepID=UPI0026109DAA|nr:hypothetical protein [Mucilaginibacter sp.]MDB4921941.1 hypothetical protein [Mucilaginibacter sp.]